MPPLPSRVRAPVRPPARALFRPDVPSTRDGTRAPVVRRDRAELRTACQRVTCTHALQTGATRCGRGQRRRSAADDVVVRRGRTLRHRSLRPYAGRAGCSGCALPPCFGHVIGHGPHRRALAPGPRSRPASPPAGEIGHTDSHARHGGVTSAWRRAASRIARVPGAAAGTSARDAFTGMGFATSRVVRSRARGARGGRASRNDIV